MEKQRTIKIPLIIGGLVLVITIGAGLVVALVQSNSSTDSVSNTAPPQPNISNLYDSTSNNNSNSDSNNLKYKDGSFSATGSYRTPEGTGSILVRVEIKEDRITALTVTDKSTDRESKQYNSQFIKGINGIVVGRSIDTNFAPRVVNGASLTINGFDKAIALIRSQARN